jgi:predicted MFS family arabinose efflux permease
MVLSFQWQDIFFDLLIIDAISYAASVISLLFIKANFQGKREVAARKLWVEIWEGLCWLWHHPLFRYMALFTGGCNLIFSGYTLILIVLAQSMHVSSSIIGVILAVGGLGGIVGAIIAPYLQRCFSFGRLIIASCWMMAITMALYLVAPNLIVLGMVGFFSLIASPVYNVVQFSYRSALIPDALQGRVNSVFRLIAFGGLPIGLALIGWLLQSIGATMTIICCAIALSLLALSMTFNGYVRHAQPLTSKE